MLRSYIHLSLMALLTFYGCKSDSKDDCEPGTLGCACGEGDSCDEGLVCVDGICAGESLVGLSISTSDARSCEVLLAETAGGVQIVGVQNDDKVQATHVRQGQKSAVTFISKSDDKIGSGSVQVRVAGYEEGSVEVSKSSCADKDGKVIEGSEVTLKQ